MKIIDSDLIYFFKNANSFTQFERKKKIYDLTNNLDMDLLLDLKADFEGFIFKINYCFRIQKGGDLIKELVVKDLDKEIIDFYLENKKYESLEDIRLDYCIFRAEINEIIKRKIGYNIKKPTYKKRKIYKFFLEKDYHVEDGSNDEDFNDAIYGIEDMFNSFSNNQLDLSDTSISGKIIYLERLGVIQYLKSLEPFNTSINSMASILSAVTGAKPTSIQPLLNGLLSQGVDNKNNPMKSIKTVTIIENKLLSIGFKRKS